MTASSSACTEESVDLSVRELKRIIRIIFPSRNFLSIVPWPSTRFKMWKATRSLLPDQQAPLSCLLCAAGNPIVLRGVLPVHRKDSADDALCSFSHFRGAMDSYTRVGGKGTSRH